MDCLVAGGEEGLVGCEEGGFPSVAFIHHQNHIEESVENSPQRLDKRAKGLVLLLLHYYWPILDPDY